MAHEREGYISTSGLKSDVTIVFLDPDFLYDARISAIRPQISILFKSRYTNVRIIIIIITRNTFCGTWYLPHSHVHNQWTNCSYNYGRMHGAWTRGYISTSGLKSDVTLVLLDPDFLQDAQISAIRPWMSVILRIFHCACAKRPYFHFRSKIW